jgi:acyl-coenzyme A thioesterase PaaI-like protein
MAPTTEPYVVPAATLSHFQSNQWANSLISSLDYIPAETRSRTAKPTGEDAFFANTLGAADAIPYCLSLVKRDIVTPGPESESQPQPSKQKPKPDMITLFQLSRPGVVGHPSIAHGGVIATLLDEIMSLAVSLHIPSSGSGLEEREIRDRIFTVNLETRFRKQVFVPGLVVVRAWCVAAEGGRKFWMRGEIVQEEGEGESDGGGHLEWAKRKRVCADAKGFWLVARAEKL